MSEEVNDPRPQVLLHLGDATYDLSPIYEALAWARDAMIGVDVHNAAKNLSQVRQSPIVGALDGALELLRTMVDRHATEEPDLESATA